MIHIMQLQLQHLLIKDEDRWEKSSDMNTSKNIKKS